jgi:hypothetical protein
MFAMQNQSIPESTRILDEAFQHDYDKAVVARPRDFPDTRSEFGSLETRPVSIAGPIPVAAAIVRGEKLARSAGCTAPVAGGHS